MMAGESWTAALDPARPLYARVRSRGALDLGELARLGGQDPAVSGALTGAIDATGSLADLQVTGTLRVDGMRPASGGDVRADAAVDFRAAGGVGTATARLTPRGFSPVTGVIEGPFGFTRAGDGGLSWLNPTGSVTGRIDFPRTRMEVFRAFAPGVTRLDGTLAGGVEVGGTISRPELNGALTLANGLVEFSPRAPRIANVQASVAFDTSRAVIERFTGDVGAGPFALRGSIGLTDPTNPSMDLTLEGRKILIARDRELRMRANIDLVARGDAGGGAVTGAIRLVDSRIYKRIEITPLLVPSPVDDQVYVPPRLAGRIPPPWSAWTMNVTIANETPFRILGNIASGEIVPELTIGGTLGDPLPEGTVRLLNTQAFLPFTTMTIENGRIDFTRAAPWIPQLDVRATAQAADYSIQAYASGPITERQLILRSDPPLSQESIITLLTTGLVPGTFTGSGFGEAAAGQGSLLLLRALARQFEPEGVDLDSLVNRVNLAAVPPQYPGAASGLRGTFRLWEGLSLLTERDDLGYYNAGVTYSLRLK
jgi:autotransporter translocation and assembly factor TamB